MKEKVWNMRVLILEDEPMLLASIETMLARENITTLGLDDVAALDLSTLDGSDFDVLLIDVWHKGVPEFDMIETLRQRFAKARLVVMSGGGGWISLESTVALTEFSQPDAVLLKPFSRDELLTAIGS